jgi:DNA recombination protein RmuC
MQAVNTGDEAFMEAHAKRIKAHIKTLGNKSYWEQFSQSPEFVLMFLPGESFFSSAIKKDPTLVEFGVQERVIITTPITLIALLKAISFSWRNEAIAKNAKQIGEVGRNLFYSLEKLVDASKSFYKKIQKTVEEYEKIDRFIEVDIVNTTRKLHVLGLEAGNDPAEDATHDLEPPS